MCLAFKQGLNSECRLISDLWLLVAERPGFHILKRLAIPVPYNGIHTFEHCIGFLLIFHLKFDGYPSLCEYAWIINNRHYLVLHLILLDSLCCGAHRVSERVLVDFQGAATCGYGWIAVGRRALEKRCRLQTVLTKEQLREGLG
jgi:hypothetical protein